MKKITLTLGFIFVGLVSYQTASAQNINDLLNGLFGKNATAKSGTTKQSSGLGAGLSNADISQGLKEALNIGANNASKSLSVKDGFFRNAAVKILMPKEVQHIEKTLRQFGLGSLADNAILYMNRAAEDAASKAGPIFLDAIRQITLNDALNILRGGNDAATKYLQKMTQQQLINAFSPVIKNSLTKVGADRAWETAFSAYNKIGIGNKVNTDLTQYVTQRATEGMFITIAQEEMKIRQNPAAFGSKILNSVFGNK